METVGEAAPEFELCVTRWCLFEAPRDQVAIKVKPKLTNGSSEPLAIGIAPPTGWRLIVDETVDVSKWTPPRPTGDNPVPLKLNGTEVWGIPPNGDGEAEHVGDAVTFATHWDATTLEPGSFFLDERNREGDLVFYMPDADPDPQVAPGLMGLAFVRDGQIVTYTSVNEWGVRADPNSF